MAVSPSAWAGGGAVETTQRLRRSREGHDEQAAGRCFWRFLQRCGPRRCLVRASEASGPRLAADAAHTGRPSARSLQISVPVDQCPACVFRFCTLKPACGNSCLQSIHAVPVSPRRKMTKIRTVDACQGVLGGNRSGYCVLRCHGRSTLRLAHNPTGDK